MTGSEKSLNASGQGTLFSTTGQNYCPDQVHKLLAIVKLVVRSQILQTFSFTNKTQEKVQKIEKHKKEKKGVYQRLDATLKC